MSFVTVKCVGVCGGDVWMQVGKASGIIRFGRERGRVHG